MISYNKVVLVGKTSEAKVIQAGESTVANFGLVTRKSYKKDNEWQNKDTWHNIVAWGKLGELAGNYIKSGTFVLVEGEIEVQSWEKDGVKQSKTQIRATNIQWVNSKEEKTEEPHANEAAPDDLPF